MQMQHQRSYGEQAPVRCLPGCANLLVVLRLGRCNGVLSMVLHAGADLAWCIVGLARCMVGWGAWDRLWIHMMAM